jgi:hypothetical protein
MAKTLQDVMAELSPERQEAIKARAAEIRAEVQREQAAKAKVLDELTDEMSLEQRRGVEERVAAVRAEWDRMDSGERV